MQWMISHQDARRNLSPGELIYANSMVADEIALENKEKMLEGTLNSHEVRKKDGCVQMDTPKNNVRDRSTNTREQVAKMSGVGTGTVARYDAIYNSDDEVLLDLLESNIRRRGEIGGSAKKVGKHIKELERLYGIRNGSANEKGNNRIGEPNNSVDQKSQSDLAAQMGISVDTLQNYKLLAEMIPELSDLVDTGIVTKTTALAIISLLDNNRNS